jgi:uncharacterized protein (TIGR00730 family)
VKRICVFCGSHVGTDPAYAQMARESAQAIVAAGYGIVYGGGGIGLMKILADTALATGGEVVGVIPYALAGPEMAHQGLTQLHVVETMHERKALMENLSAAYMTLPGGFGTMDEFCEVLSWRQLQIHDKPIGLLNFRGYYDALLSLFDSMVREGFVGPHTRGLFIDARSADELLAAMFEEKT